MAATSAGHGKNKTRSKKNKMPEKEANELRGSVNKSQANSLEAEMVEMYSEDDGDKTNSLREESVGCRDRKGSKRGRQDNSTSEESGSEEETNRTDKESVKLIAILRFNETAQGNMMKLNPILLTTVLANKIGDIKYAKVLNDGNLMVVCKDEAQLAKALKVKEIGKNEVINSGRVGANKNRGCRGIITNVPFCLKMEEVKENLTGGRIVQLQRMTTIKDGGKKRETETVMIEFEGDILPQKVLLGYMSYPVRPYVPKPLRCFKCQRFGHMAKSCREKVRCARCGGGHEYGKCGEGVRPKCCNCGGNHSVAYRGCEVLRREVEVQQIRVKEKISYAEAVKINRQEKQSKEYGFNKGQMTANMEQEGKTNKWEERKKLVTFIAGVINATDEVKSKTERIQIIVKAAAYHLGMRDLKWEEVRDSLNEKASQELSVG